MSRVACKSGALAPDVSDDSIKELQYLTGKIVYIQSQLQVSEDKYLLSEWQV